MAAKRKHVATRGQAPVESEKAEREDRDLRRPLRDAEIEELLAVAAQAVLNGAPKMKEAPGAPPRVSHPAQYAARRAAYHQLPDRERRACLLLHLLDEAGPGGRLDADAGASISAPHATSGARRDH